MQKKEYFVDRIIKWFTYGMLILTIFFVLISIFSNETDGEAGIGSFDSSSLNEGWILSRNGMEEVITLPLSVEAEIDELLEIKNTLPEHIPDGSNLLVRASMSDLYIYIDGELRESYDSEHLSHKSYYIPSAYVGTELSEADSGAEIKIVVRVKTKGNLNEVNISNGNNAWFKIIKNNIAVNAVALIVLTLGIILVLAASAMSHIADNSKTVVNLGLLMIDISIWVFSESELRQLIMKRPSLSAYFAYFSVELIGVFACMFFDEAQHRRHHKGYAIMESIISIQMAVNLILHFTGISDLYRTLLFSHLWMGIAIVFAIVSMVMDIRSKTIKQYKAIALGLVGFIIMASMELAGFYVTRFYVFGIFVCIGLIVLATATVIQVLLDQISNSHIYKEKQTKMIVNTIETIAGSIDAKDEYTGGHSERVGQYASILARGMAADYNFSEEDIQRIHYIGLLHDIGKIGVADTVLNKPGRLTENEFSLMKKHVDIGAEIMEGMEENIPGLLEGIKYHHERFDGKGYPEGLSETDIPLVARILCLADCYDAMTSNRIYRKRLTDEEVRAEFIRCCGTQFDPALTDIFVSLLDSGEMHPYTVDGMATLKKGKILKSAVLENYLQEQNFLRENIATNPEHVRMLCFIMKLKEKKGEQEDILFVGLPDNGASDQENTDSEKMDRLEKFIKTRIKASDVCIDYNERMRLVAFFGRSPEEIESMKNELVDLKIGKICKQI